MWYLNLGTSEYFNIRVMTRTLDLALDSNMMYTTADKRFFVPKEPPVLVFSNSRSHLVPNVFLVAEVSQGVIFKMQHNPSFR